MRTDPPASTYRVQLHPGFPFAAAAGIAPYLAELGVSHLYCSPYLQAATGSTHGYDVVDPTRPNDELGGDAGRAALVAALGEHGLKQVLDIVPNHVCVANARANPWWWDVLRHGRGSRYAGYFDVDWDALEGRVLLPVLGDSLEAVLDRGELTVAGEMLRYFEHEFPLADGTAGLPPRECLDRQHYELAHWREANQRLNYRRFFDVTALAGVRVEWPEVFDATHARIGEWVARGELDGLRVDHPDGLADPRGYAERLRALAPDAWIVVEKILAPGERLPRDWPVDGTTGYDALNVVTRLFVDPAGEAGLTDTYRRFTGESADWAEVADASRREVLERILAAEVSRLAALAGSGRHAVAELLAAYPVYRTYLRPGYPAGPDDAAVLRAAVATASERRPDLAPEIERLGERVLTGGEPELTTRLQQTTAAALAKGVEDTAFYRYPRFVALNEVGGDPAHWSVPIAEFHAYCAARQRTWPATMTTLSTHDTKRGEDVRARLVVLSELPDEWAAAVGRWSKQAVRHGEIDPATEYLLWQTIVGAHPIPAERLRGYAAKATREAKRATSWLDPDPAYERAVARWIGGVLGDGDLMADVAAFVDVVRVHGWVVSLAQKLVQLTMPGVPDVYQGSELWDGSLVDPDNRRPVDFALRRRLLAELDRLTPEEIGARAEQGLPKLLVVSRALRLRRERPADFGRDGGYRSLPVTGAAAGHVVAFARGEGVVTVVPRLVTRVPDDWGDTAVALPDGGWRNVLTGERAGSGSLATLLGRFPVALLAAEGR